MSSDSEIFESYRAPLLSLAYRMLGEMGAAEDMVQEAWLRWMRRDIEVNAPKAYLLKVVTHLCLNELDSARARKEESRSDRLPEPIDMAACQLTHVESLDSISMAFLVVLQRLTPAERAVLLLHDVFDFSHQEICQMIGKSEQACRQLLKRARDHITTEKRQFSTPPESHQRILHAFMRASRLGDVDAIASLLAHDAMLIADAGPQGAQFGRIRNLPAPIIGAGKIAAFLASVTPQGMEDLTVTDCELNGEPAVLFSRDGKPFSAIIVAIGADGKIWRVFIQADESRLSRVGRVTR